MTEELQSLLDRIQKDGVAKAREQAEAIEVDAKAQAQELLEKARAEAEEIKRTAEKEAEDSQSRANIAIQQAARDLIISLGDSIQQVLQSIVHTKVEEALAGDTLERVLLTAVKAYTESESGTGGIYALVPANQQEQITRLFMSELRAEMERGLEVRSDSSVLSGFKVSFANGDVQHDFTTDAIAESLAQLLRPHLAAIVRNAAQDEG